MNMKQLIYAIVIFYVFVACKPEPPLATKTVVVLYDLSASVDKTSLENYETFSNLIFDKLHQVMSCWAQKYRKIASPNATIFAN